MDGRKIDKLIASRPQKKPAPAAGRSGRLELPELLLEPVDVVAGEIIGLLDDPVAGRCGRGRRRAARRAARPRSASEPRELLEADEAELVQRSANLGPTPLIRHRSSPALPAPSSLRADRRAEHLAGDVAGRRRGFAGEAAPFGRACLRHVRPDRGAVGQLHPLPRAKQDERQRQRNATTRMSHQYSRMKSIMFTNSIVRCSDGEARPDRRAAARKGSPGATPPRLRRSAAARRPCRSSARCSTPGSVSMSPRQLAALEVVGGPGQHHVRASADRDAGAP